MKRARPNFHQLTDHEDHEAETNKVDDGAQAYNENAKFIDQIN